jgi:NADH:ubiquinone oxidoreductase subunit 3 (subunit A)
LVISAGILVLIFYWLTNLYAYSFSRNGKVLLYREFYECGFKAIPDTRIAIDLQFSILGLIFLIYDMEIVILVPILVNSLSLPFIAHIVLIFVLLILGISY